MADGGHIVKAQLRLATPLVDDFCYLARRMRADEVDQFLALTGMDEFNSDVCARAAVLSNGPNWALLGPDDRPLFLGGFCPLRPGVYTAWAMGTPEAWTQHWHAITRVCRRAIRDLFASGAHRVEVLSLASRTEACAWYRDGLGMRFEGTHLRASAFGQDLVTYAKVAP